MESVGDTVSGLELFDSFPNGFDDSRAFGTEREWKRRGKITTPVVYIDEVEPRRVKPNPHFARSRLGRLDFPEAQNLGAAIFIDPYYFHAFSTIRLYVCLLSSANISSADITLPYAELSAARNSASGISSSFRTSGPPNSSKQITLVVAFVVISGGASFVAPTFMPPTLVRTLDSRYTFSCPACRNLIDRARSTARCA